MQAGKRRDATGLYRDILEITRVVGSALDRDEVIRTVLTNLCERLGKRARCAFLEGEELRLRFWAGHEQVPIGGLPVHKESIVWEAIRKGTPVNLTDPHQTDGYRHTLAEPIKIKAIIPLGFVDPMTRQEKKLGALIVDSGKEGVAISAEDFEYLQVIGHLIGAIAGRADLIQQLMTSCRRQEDILMETAHNFRNRIAIIGGYSRRIAQLARGTELGEKAGEMHQEVRALESHLKQFEKYMSG
jgi:hypothetical protein